MATRQIHDRDGTLHRHGARHDPCPGSNKPPLQADSQPQVPADRSASSFNANPSNSASSVAVTRSTSVWSPDDSTVIKHIPKSARTSCASHLAALLRKTVSNPDSTSIIGWNFSTGDTRSFTHQNEVGSAITSHRPLSFGSLRTLLFSLIANSPTQLTKLGGR